MLSYLEIVEKAKHSCDETEVINLIEEYKLEREQLLTEHLKSKQVSDFHVFFPDISASHCVRKEICNEFKWHMVGWARETCSEWSEFDM